VAVSVSHVLVDVDLELETAT